MSSRALVVIDVQNDYFPEGNFPLWNTATTLDNTLQAIALANANNVPVIFVQHVVPGQGLFFSEGTPGADIHPEILKAAPTAPIVVKQHADSFLKTNLEETLAGLGTTELLVSGMMTHNCVTHTAISKAAEKYKVTVLGDCTTTVSEPVHFIALAALGDRVPVVPYASVFP